MVTKMSKHVKGRSGSVLSGGRDRTPTYIHLVSNSESTACDSLDFLGTELGNDRSPLADCSRADPQRPRDIRGALKVIHNVLLEHAPSLTAVHDLRQPQSKTRVLTSVHMDKLSTLAERLKEAMGDTVSAADLARECDVSDAAVHKWLVGRTLKLSAENYEKAGRALGVRAEWLRTGKLPREREHGNDERQIDRVIELLQQLREPLAALSGAIEQLAPSTKIERKKQPR